VKGYIHDGSGLSTRIRVAKTIESAMTAMQRIEENISVFDVKNYFSTY